jgi:hypothetical protein
MKTMGIAYAGTLISFVIIDALWLGIIAKDFYRTARRHDVALP